MQNNHKNNNNNNAFFNNKNSFGITDNSDYVSANLPMGLSMAFCQNAAAMTAFENMSDAQKREIIDRASKVSSKKEMTSLVQNIAMNNLSDYH